MKIINNNETRFRQLLIKSMETVTILFDLNILQDNNLLKKKSMEINTLTTIERISYGLRDKQRIRQQGGWANKQGRLLASVQICTSQGR